MADRTPFSVRLQTFPFLRFLMTILIALLLLQIMAYLVSLFYPPASSLKLGWVVLIIAATIAVWLSIQIIQTRIIGKEAKPFTRGEAFILLVMVAGVVAALIYLPPLVPQVFDQAVLQLQSIVGIP